MLVIFARFSCIGIFGCSRVSRKALSSRLNRDNPVYREAPEQAISCPILGTWTYISYFLGQDHNNEYRVAYKMVAALWTIIGLAWATCALRSAQELFCHMHHIKATRKIVPEISQIPWHVQKKEIELKERDTHQHTPISENTHTFTYNVQERTIPSHSVYI